MFLRCKRRKDGMVHHDWSIVENRHVISGRDLFTFVADFDGRVGAIGAGWIIQSAQADHGSRAMR
jgi:hypothetical protein